MNKLLGERSDILDLEWVRFKIRTKNKIITASYTDFFVMFFFQFSRCKYICELNNIREIYVECIQDYGNTHNHFRRLLYSKKCSYSLYFFFYSQII